MILLLKFSINFETPLFMGAGGRVAKIQNKFDQRLVVTHIVTIFGPFVRVEIYDIIRTDRRTDGQIDLAISSRLLTLIMIIYYIYIFG